MIDRDKLAKHIVDSMDLASLIDYVLEIERDSLESISEDQVEAIANIYGYEE